jgi:hypothetical protein
MKVPFIYKALQKESCPRSLKLKLRREVSSMTVKNTRSLGKIRKRKK